MKRFYSFVCTFLVLIASTCCITACGLLNTEESSEAKKFSTVVFNDKTLDYNGEEHTIEATGVPENATVTYTDAGPYTLPGSYEIGVKITAEGYTTYEKTATLTIKALTFTTVVFNNKTLDYNGEEHTIEATGVPENATVTYTNNGPFVNAGEYNISIKVKAVGYQDYTKTVKLKINKIDFPSNIVFEDDKVIKTGSEKSIFVEGDIPQGTQITYTNNKGTEAGVYNATAVLTNPNYNTKTLTATLTIIDIISTGKNTIDTLLDRPDPWAFMPEAFSKEELANNTSSAIDFSTSKNVSSINKKFMGKQMYVLWEGLDGIDVVLEKFDLVFAIGETIASAYQNFINDNPDNYSEWSGTVAGFNITIALDNGKSIMTVQNSVFALELYADSDENINKGKIQIAQGATLNYETSDNYLKANIALTIKGILVMKQIEFVRNEETETVAGYFYEYAGLKSVATKTSAVVAFNEDYTVVMSTKKESEDLLVLGYEEVYSSKTGEFISAEVLENNKLTDFDTFWVNAYDVAGISKIKAVANGKVSLNENVHDIYVNGSTSIFKPSKNKILMVETSRKFDIEMRTVYYLVATTQGEKTTYTVEETQIPMVFVQKNNISTFSEDIVKENKNTFTTTPSLPTLKISVANNNFASLKTTLDGIKELLTYEELEAELAKGAN